MAAAISRVASTFEALRVGLIHDLALEMIVEGDLHRGVHRNPDVTGRPEWFTLAYFHLPDQLRDEVAGAGFADVQIVAIEGLGAVAAVDHQLDDPVRRHTVMRAIRRVETEPSLLGASPHLMAIATKRSAG